MPQPQIKQIAGLRGELDIARKFNLAFRFGPTDTDALVFLNDRAGSLIQASAAPENITTGSPANLTLAATITITVYSDAGVVKGSTTVVIPNTASTMVTSAFTPNISLAAGDRIVATPSIAPGASRQISVNVQGTF